jgi:Lactonase, 7-bladed beta-propeller
MSMRLTKFGKALCMGAVSAGLIFGIGSCVESYTVGFLYVTGNVTAQSGNNGIISGYKIDHNTGRLASINGLPVSSEGANPVRAVLTLGSRFLYVLNRGVSSAGNGDCYGVGANACTNSNITEFAVGGNGILTYQQTFFTEGINPFRMIADTTGDYLLVLDHDAPDNVSPSSTDNCALALGSGVTTCADVTVFKIDQTTGRLSVVINQQVTANGGTNAGQPITYFPVPANPVDFVLSSGYLLTLTGAAAPTSYPYAGGTEVWPYTYVSTSGQLTLSQNSVQPLGIGAGTAIVSASGVIYVLDNEPVSVTVSGSTTTYPSQILPWTVTSGGALVIETSGIIPDEPTTANPIQLLVESKGKYLYVANQGNNVAGNNANSGIAGYAFFTGSTFQVQFLNSGTPFGSGAGPQCIVEDPSDQFIYEANEYDSTVTGLSLDPNTGYLNPLRATDTYKLQGQASWCLVDGRTG